MFGSTFGNLFKITTWGESHGKGIGVVKRIFKLILTAGNQDSPVLPP